MGKFKLKKLARVMPHAWFNMLKEKGIKRNSHPFNKRPSQGKPFAAHDKNKHSYRSALNHKAIDTPFPTTPKKSSSKACREEPSAKQAFCKQLESLQYGANDSSPTGSALPRGLYKCTMSPASRKICAGIIDDQQISFNTHHSNIISHDQAPSNHYTPCYNIISKEKSFHLDVQELEAKLKALSSQERLRNLYTSPLFSVAVPSPSLDGAQEYSNHDSLGNSLRFSLEGLECRKIHEDNFFYEGSSSSISFSPYSSSSSGTCINREASRSAVWGREYNSFNDCHDLFTAVEAHPLLQRPPCRGQNNTQSREGEAKNKQFLTPSPSHDNHNSFGRKRSCRSSKKSSGNRDKNTPLNEVEAGLGSGLIYTLQAQSSDQQNTQNNDVGRRRFPLLQKVNEGDINERRPVTPSIEGPRLKTLYGDGHSRPTKSHTDDLSLSDSELACKNHRRFKLLQKDKVSMQGKRKGLSFQNEIKPHSHAPVYEADGLSDAQIQLLKSSSTRSLDSSLVHCMVTSSLYDALSSGDHLGNPSFSESSGKKFPDANSRNVLAYGLEIVDIEGSSKNFSAANQPLLSRNALNASNIDKGVKGIRDYDTTTMTTVPSVSKAGLHGKASSLHDHKSSVEIKDHIAPLMHQDKLYYKKSPKHLKSSCKGGANFPCAHQNTRPSIFDTASGMPICGKHDKKVRGDDKQDRLYTDMKLSTCCRSSRCRDSLGVDMHRRRNHQQNENKDMFMRDYRCPVDDGRDSVCKSSYAIDFSDDTSSDKEVREHVKPSLSRGSNRRPFGDHLGMQCHLYQSEGYGHHQYVCSSVELGGRCCTASNQSHVSVIRRSPRRSELQYNKDVEASMMSRRSCSDLQHHNDVDTNMIGRKDCSSAQDNDDLEARMIGWGRCSRAPFDVEEKESAGLSIAQYYNDNELVSTMGRRSCSARMQYDPAILEETTTGRRSCSSVLQYDKSAYNVPVPREEDIEERRVGRRSCSSAQDEKSTEKFVQHDKDMEKRIEMRSCRSVAEYEKDKEASMIGAKGGLQRRSGSKAQYEENSKSSSTQERRSCRRESKKDKGKEERWRRAPEYDRDDDVVLHSKVMWSYNMRQDFKQSMMDVLCEVHVHADDEDDVKVYEELLELVGCYLALNPPSHHASILYAFGDLCSDLFH